MQTKHLNDLANQLPSIFDLRDFSGINDEWILVGQDALLPEGDLIEDSLFGESEGSMERGDSPDSVPLERVIEEIENREPFFEEPLSSIRQGDGPLRDNLERFPGALQRRPDSSTGYLPPPDCFAFYLPWHYFRPEYFGIYLLVEGIEEFGRQIENAARPYLTATQARRAARAFLFHHEAYHNAVETFSVRLEISHRKPCYKTGIEFLYKNWFDNHKGHEEGLADAYALDKTRNGVYSELTNRLIRNRKREIAYAALLRLVKSWPPEYASALAMLKQLRKFDPAVQMFQEQAHAASSLGTKRLAPVIWGSSLYSMAPSLQRNKSFSYLVKRSHPAIKMKLDARYLSVTRHDFLRRLKEHVGGREVTGGRHPKWQAQSGKKVPVPKKREVDEYTAGAILKQLGLNISIRDFMAD